MPFYAREIDIPASTAWDAPEEIRLHATRGKLGRVFVQGAPEHQHQVSIAIYYFGHRIFPEGEVEYFYPSEYALFFQVDAWLEEIDPILVVYGANTDDTYEHTVYVGVEIETQAGVAGLYPDSRQLPIPLELE